MTNQTILVEKEPSLVQPVEPVAISKGMMWTGRGFSIFAVLFLLMDAGMKIFKAAPAVEGTVQIGYPESTIVPMGLALLFCTILYSIPRTAVLGAMFITAYLGGAVASQVRAGQPLFQVSFPILFAVLVWGGLWLRDARLRKLVPLS